MDHFNYKNGALCCEEVSIADIASEVGTPFYCYSTATLARHYNVFSESFAAIPHLICFAVKANSNLAVLKTLANLGAGADCVSEGEIRRSITAGIAKEKIVFSGVGKAKGEIEYALAQNIGQFNVESKEELLMLNEIAATAGKKAAIALRVNPDVNAKTHDKIATGRKGDKFGIAWEDAEEAYATAKDMQAIKVVAIATHIGSQLTDLDPFRQAFRRIEELVQSLRAKGHEIKKLDLGGGLGIPYSASENPPAPREYAEMIIETVRHLDCELVLEPGRLIAGNAGILVANVILVKKTGDKTFIVLDAAMNDLARPSLYGAHHDIIPVDEKIAKGKAAKVDIVGPVCETGDIFAKDRSLPQVAPGNLVAIRSAGAYGAVMASNYNSRLLVPEVLVNGERFALVRKRQTYEELLGTEEMPDWLLKE